MRGQAPFGPRLLEGGLEQLPLAALLALDAGPASEPLLLLVVPMLPYLVAAGGSNFCCWFALLLLLVSVAIDYVAQFLQSAEVGAAAAVASIEAAEAPLARHPAWHPQTEMPPLQAEESSAMEPLLWQGC